uniref:Uncharacterized protein n=1 Tax=Catharus ustulatus TaxID=91951 RepID=A0A8C3UM83_CATUS
MADCGGLPQVVQPGKLTEAFKYFVQGMGYSKWQTQLCGLEQVVVKGTQCISPCLEAEDIVTRVCHTNSCSAPCPWCS